MGNNVTPEYIRGFIIPMDVGVDNIWQSETTITQQNPTAGDPIPQQSSKMRLLATGNQSDSGDLSIVTRKAGSAGFGSRFTFKENTTSTTVEYGRDAMNSISGFEWKLFGKHGHGYIVQNPHIFGDFLQYSIGSISTHHKFFQYFKGATNRQRWE